jgi:PilZ domain-containing protein
MMSQQISSGAVSSSPKSFSIEARIKIVSVRGRARLLSFGQSDQLSEEGLTLDCPQPLEVNEKVELEFSLPRTKELLKFTAVVKSASNSRYHLEFVTPTSRQQEQLTRACRELSLLQRA